MQGSQGEIVSEWLGRGSLTASELAQLADVVFSVEELVRVPPLLQGLGDFTDLLKNLVLNILSLVSQLELSSELLSLLKEWLEMEVEEAPDQLRNDEGQTKVILMIDDLL